MKPRQVVILSVVSLFVMVGLAVVSYSLFAAGNNKDKGYESPSAVATVSAIDVLKLHVAKITKLALGCYDAATIAPTMTTMSAPVARTIPDSG